MCNGYAKPKFENGKCICTFPYIGETCESCEEDGFEPQTIRIKAKMPEDETAIICVPKKGSKYENCNGFGEYNQKRRSCTCDSLHAGSFCEECAAPNKAYPDCTEQQETDVINSEVMRDYDKRRRSQVYGVDDYLLAEANNIFRQQCPLTNYPNFLNDIYYHKQFASGDFHLADFYVTNHDADNVIQFTPKKQGSLKIMIKQPEAYNKVYVEEALDIEIAVAQEYDKKFLKTETNYEIDFKGKLGNQKTDFTELRLEITENMLNNPLLIFFRGMNYTHDDLRASENKC